MKTLRCPHCGGSLEISIGPLHPMEAVAVDMLEHGIILRCSNCGAYLTDASDIECPKCSNRTLATSFREAARREPMSKNMIGKISCASCGWEQKAKSRE